MILLHFARSTLLSTHDWLNGAAEIERRRKNLEMLRASPRRKRDAGMIHSIFTRDGHPGIYDPAMADALVATEMPFGDTFPAAEQSAAERTAAEPVEPRAEAEGNGRPAQHAPGTVPGTRVPGAGLHTAQHRRGYPRWEPYAGKLQVRVCAGGAR